MSNFKWKIFSNFLAFSEYPNFTRCSPLRQFFIFFSHFLLHSSNRSLLVSRRHDSRVVTSRRLKLWKAFPWLWNSTWIVWCLSEDLALECAYKASSPDTCILWLLTVTAWWQPDRNVCNKEIHLTFIHCLISTWYLTLYFYNFELSKNKHFLVLLSSLARDS